MRRRERVSAADEDRNRSQRATNFGDPRLVRYTARCVSSLPTKEVIDAALAIVVRDGLVLIAQRKDGDTLGGYWEFPGGKCEDGESLEQCLARELREELDIAADPLRRLATIEHDYPYALVRLHPFICAYRAGEPKLLECQDCRWIEPPSLRKFQFPPANEQLLEEVIAVVATMATPASSRALPEGP